jgi:hypothetical protein
MTTEYREVAIEDIMRYFTKGFELPEGTVATQEWLYDPHQGKVLFKFYVDEPSEERHPK